MLVRAIGNDLPNRLLEAIIIIIICLAPVDTLLDILTVEEMLM